MTAAAATVIAAIAAGILGLIVAVVNAAVGRDGRRTDKMETIADSGLKLLNEEQERRSLCEDTLRVFKRVLRAWVRAYRSGDAEAIERAYADAVDTLDSY